MLKPLSFAFLSLITVVASAATYYKWTDPNGTPHYSQYAPTNGVDLKKVQVINTREVGPATAVATGGQPVSSSTGATQTPEQKRIADLEAQKKESNKVQTQERCKSLKNNLANLSTGGRIYEMDDRGERKYLDGRDIELKRQKTQQAFNQFCK